MNIDRRPIPSAPGYFADNLGQIWSTYRNWTVNDGHRIIAVALDRHGYARVRLHINKREVRRQVHRLICEAFHGPADGREVRHLDGNRLNNHPTNLAWGTGAQNAADRKHHGTEYGGDRHHNAQKDTCPAGHLYTEANTYVTPKGKRECRICKRARSNVGRKK